MAAYAALVSLMNDLDDIQNHPRHSFSFDSKQITSLSKTVNFLIDFLESYDSHGRSIEALESRVTSAARAAHDVIESHVVGQIQSGSTLGEKLPRTYFLLDLQKAIDNMDFVWRKAMQFKAKGGLLKAYSPAAASTSGKSNMVGFDAVRDQLMHMITGELSGHRQVIPLVGMGGIGKTTLAKNAYEHSYVKQHFDVRLWATISQQYSAETIFKQLSTTGEEELHKLSTDCGEELHKLSTDCEEELHKLSTDCGEELHKLSTYCGEELHKKLWGRRYLIVLDDMWSLEAWNEIQMFMPDNGNGSCVIVTTRLSNLAAHLSSSPFKMNFLNKVKSWELFCGVAFGQEECPLELEKIGKKIVERCRGLPLSITVIAGHLRKSTRAMEYWEKVASLMNPISSSVDGEQCLKIISLSYHHLPAYLKPCFLYIGIYREDEWIDASELVKLWIAEGFLKPKQSLSLEEVAEECLKDLSDRNLILVREMKWSGKGEYYGIHDTMRELCLKLGKKEKFMCALEAIAIARKRGIVMQCPEWKHGKSVGILKINLSVRSRVGRGECYSGTPWVDFRFMRCHFQLLNLHHFQFNLCRGDGIGSFYLLSSISLLWNVKTLIITHCRDISVPYEIWEMPQLRHLEFRGVCLPDPLPNQEECIVLQKLHTLLGVKDFKLTGEVCKRMPNIKNLSLAYHHFPADLEAACSYYCPHNLSRFSKLESLTCGFHGDDSEWNGFVLSFTFPSSLLKLTLCQSRLHWEDLTMMIKSLHHLEVLELHWVKGPEWNLVEEFPRLKTLLIWRSDLIYWNANSSHFPLLQILYISGFPELSEIPFDIGEIPTLKRITLDRCSVSAAISAMRIVVEQESFGNQDLRLHVIFGELEEEERFQKMLQEEGLRSNSLHLSRTTY